MLVKLLQSFPALEYLYYENGTAGEVVFEPERVLEAISYSKPTLEDLTLINSWSQDWSYSGLENRPIVSLAGFRKLKSIKMTFSLLVYRSDIHHTPVNHHQIEKNNLLLLPQSLESLTLKDCDETAVLPSSTWSLTNVHIFHTFSY